MQATSPGQNRTGAATSIKQVDLMLRAVEELSPPRPVDTSRVEEERQVYITEADSLGSIPPAKPSGTNSKSSKTKKAGRRPEELGVFMDKLGERLAFERTGTRLYEALITKYQALAEAGQDPLPPADDTLLADSDESESDEPISAAEALEFIRADELSHFQLLSDCIRRLGGDPTAQTPCADAAATASMGLMQVVTDPRTTLAQSLNAILMAELADTAGWEMLAELAEEAGQKELASTFLQALEAEQGHLATVRMWLQALLTNEAGTLAV